MADTRRDDTPRALSDARGAIDEADRDLLRLLGRRFDAVRRIAEIKAGDGDAAFQDATRERELASTWARDAEALGVPTHLAQQMLKEILRYSRRVQEPLLEGDHAAARPATPRVGYQGVPGSYSSLAAERLFGTRSPEGVELVPHPTFVSAVEAVQSGKIDYALLPVENSISGSIIDVNRLICDRALHAVDEEVWEVDHVLAARPGTRLEDIHAIRTHPAALAQCDRFLGSLDGVALEPWFDTAGAAASIVAEGRSDLAAVCSEDAATAHGLEVVCHDIADHGRNETRFLLLAREPETPDPRLPCKTSLVLRLNHHEGALARVLQTLAEGGVNLLRIESRPSPDSGWEYRFFIDVEGHRDAPHLVEALRRAKRCCNHLRIVGSYPRRTHRPNPLEEQAPPVETGAGDGAGNGESATGTPPVVESPPLTAPDTESDRSSVRVRDVTVGDGRFVLIAGPCAVENRQQILDGAAMVRAAGARILRGGAFKPRTSPYSFQGLGEEGLRYLREAGDAQDMPVVTEILRVEDIPAVVAHADMLQVGARNMQNFPLLRELGTLDVPVLLKRGMSATVKELLLAAEYILAAGNQRVILCERGIRTFETSTRSTLDLAAVPVLRRETHLPVIVDPSHAAGVRHLVVPLALAAAAAGADGLIVEAHPRPDEALCDREQALTHEGLAELTAGLDRVVGPRGERW